jgi:exopolyphosphatase / guanosine-5'-triphosphate,3'-diphosphate pyrophosphatase
LENIASIDIGSNTLRLLIAELTDKGYRPILRDREIVRLGGNFYPRKLLSDSAMAHAVKVLIRFKKLADQHGVTRIKAVGTGVLREAYNSLIFLEKIRKEANISIRILSGEEEAQIMARGVTSGTETGEAKALVFDMGGGSTEFVFVEGIQGRALMSLPLGVVTLTEQFLLSDPPSTTEQQSLRDFGRKILRENFSINDNIKYLIGTAGTVTTLAAMAENLRTYDPDIINGMALTRNRLEQMADQILSLNLAQRLRLTGLEAGRADLIAAGILMVLEIMEHFSQEILWVSDSGLLEGIILSEGIRSRV